MDEVLSPDELAALFEAMARPPEPTAPPVDASAVEQRLGLVGRVPLTVTVEIGRVRLSLARLYDLRPGDALVLDRPVGTRLPLMVAGRAVAQGAPVVHGEHLALRIEHLDEPP